jgi:anti-sigma B factor antagonist
VALEINRTDLEGVIVLEPSGRLVLGQESMDFRRKIGEILDSKDGDKDRQGSNARIVLDLGKLSTVDSSGLGALIAARVSASNRGGAIKLASLTKKLRDVLAISKLVTVFDIYDNVDAAVQAFAHSQPAGVVTGPA